MKGNKEPPSRRSVLHSVQGEAPKRRGFLKSTVAAVGSVLGLSSSATAVDSVDRDALQAAAREYYSPEQVRDALETHGGDLLTELADQGYLDTGSVSTLPVDTLHSAEEFGPGTEGSTVVGVKHGNQIVAKIQIRKQLAGRGELVVEVVPAEDRSFAVLRTGVTDTQRIVSPSNSISDCIITNTNCEVYCGPYSCTCKVAYYYDCDNSSYCEMQDECSSCSTEGC